MKVSAGVLLLLCAAAGRGNCFLLQAPTPSLSTPLRLQQGLHGGGRGATAPPPPLADSPSVRVRPGSRNGGCWMAAASAGESWVHREASKTKLLAALGGLDRGFWATKEQRKEVERIIEELVAMSPDQSPAETLLKEDSKWELLYSDAPDIVGSGTGNGGGLSPSNGEIGQEFNAAEGTITNLVELKPPGALSSLLPDDSLQLQVVINARAMSPTRVGMNIRGTRAVPRNFGGVDVSRLPPLRLDLPVQPPFGEFEILYYDGDLRIVKTGQGYFGVNRRVAD